MPKTVKKAKIEKSPFQFRCLNPECRHVYSKNMITDGTWHAQRDKFKCPKCGSMEKENVYGKCASFIGSSDLKNSDHDYRFKNNLPKVQQERINAEKAAKESTGFTSAKPYREINDLNGNNFGEVK